MRACCRVHKLLERNIIDGYDLCDVSCYSHRLSLALFVSIRRSQLAMMIEWIRKKLAWAAKGLLFWFALAGTGEEVCNGGGNMWNTSALCHRVKSEEEKQKQK